MGASSSASASNSANTTSATSTDANSTRPTVRTAHEGLSKLASHFEEVLRGFPERLRELLRHHSWLRGCEHRRTQLLRWFLLRRTGRLLLWLVRLPRQRQRDHRMTHVPLESGQVFYLDRMEFMRCKWFVDMELTEHTRLQSHPSLTLSVQRSSGRRRW